MKERILICFALFCVTALVAGCSCGGDDDDSAAPSDDDSALDDDTQPSDDDTGDDTDDDCEEAPPSANEHTLLGLDYLRAAAGGLARVEFIEAMSEDALDQDALYGRILAGTLMEFDTIGVIALYVKMILGYEPAPDDDAKADDDTGDSFQGIIDDIVDSALQNLVLQFTDDIEVLGPEALGVECLSLELDKMPIILALDTVAEPGGEDWDHSEVLASMSVTQQLGGLVRLLTVLNFDFDLSYIFGIGDIDWDSYSTTEIISIVVDILHTILHDPAYPDFLTMSGDGLDDFQHAQIEIGRGFGYAVQTYEQIRSEIDVQTDDILGYEDANQNGAYDEGERFVIPPWGALDDEQQAVALAFEFVFAGLRDSFLDRTEFDADPATDTPFDLQRLNAILQALGIPPLLPSLEIDFASWFEDASPDGFRNGLRGLVDLLAALLPAPPPY